MGFIKLLVILVILYFCYVQFKKFGFDISYLKSINITSLLFSHWFLWIVIIICIPLNYSLEAFKWQTLLKNIENINFFDSLKSILIGLALGNVTPMMSGDYAARASYLMKKHRKDSIYVNIMGSFMQSLIALSFGIYGLYFLIYLKITFPYLHELFIVISIITSIGYFAIVWKTSDLNILISKIGLHSFTIPYFSLSHKAIIFGISLLRYLSYGIQYVLMFYAFDCNLDLTILIAGVSLLYLAKTIGGGLNMFGDLGLRLALGLSFFAIFDIRSELITIISMLIWIFNILLPMLLGLAFFWLSKKEVND